jgi:AbiV family abortive infection protein
MVNNNEIHNLNKAIPKVLKNGDRLIEDARQLLDLNLPPTVYALCILAQEEYAKAFLLYLISGGALPWSEEVRWLLHDHTCKQLVASIIDFLQPKDLFKWLDKRSEEGYQLPSSIIDAISIIHHEKSRKEPKSSWFQESGRSCDRKARKIADGYIDKNKQNAIYVEIGKNGNVISTPDKITKPAAQEEFERTERLSQFFCSNGDLDVTSASLDFRRIFLVFKLFFGQCTDEEFNKY